MREVLYNNYMDKADLKKFMDGEKVKIWPAKKEAKMLVLEYLSSKFEEGKKYTEKEVNEIIDKYQTFSDHATLRRELYDHYFLDRDPKDGLYWKEKEDKIPN